MNLKDNLIEIALKLLDKMRHKQLDEDLSYLLIKLVQVFIDHSINEINVRFIDHSQFYTEGAYEVLHQNVIASTVKYYESLKTYKASDIAECLSDDLNIIQRIFLMKTQVEIEKLAIELEISA